MMRFASLIFSLLFFGSPANATVSDLANFSSFANAQTFTSSALSVPVSSGVLVVIFVYDANPTTPGVGVTDTKGNTYLQAVTSGTNATNPYTSIYYSFISNALTTSDTFTYTCNAIFGGHTTRLTAVSATGYSAIDNATTASANNFSGTFSVTGAGTAAVSNEINFALIMGLSNPTVTSAGWSINPPTSADLSFIPSLQVNTGTSALTYSGTLSSQWWTALIVSFKPSGGAAVIPGALMQVGPMMGVH